MAQQEPMVAWGRTCVKKWWFPTERGSCLPQCCEIVVEEEQVDGRGPVEGHAKLLGRLGMSRLSGRLEVRSGEGVCRPSRPLLHAVGEEGLGKLDGLSVSQHPCGRTGSSARF